VPLTGHAGSDACNTSNAVFDRMDDSPHRERLLGLYLDMGNLELSYLPDQSIRR